MPEVAKVFLFFFKKVMFRFGCERLCSSGAAAQKAFFIRRLTQIKRKPISWHPRYDQQVPVICVHLWIKNSCDTPKSRFAERAGYLPKDVLA
jgi:hypothetical protein